MDLEKLVKIVKEELHGDVFAKRVLKEVVEEALNELVKSTETPFDDIAKAAFYPVIEGKINEKIDLLWSKF